MKKLSNQHLIYLCIILTIIALVLKTYTVANKPAQQLKTKSKVIVLPEEMMLGDTLKIDKITTDTIYIIQANKRNN